jgi:hypothetical protein
LVGSDLMTKRSVRGKGSDFENQTSSTIVSVSVIVAAILIANGVLDYFRSESASLLLIVAGFAILFIGVLVALWRGR